MERLSRDTGTAATPAETPDTVQKDEPEDEPAEPRRTARNRLRRLAIDTRPLGMPAYRRLWLGQGVSFVGFQVTAVAVPVQVYDMTRSSLWVGVLGFVNLVPLIVFGLWGGAIADHMDRRRLLFVSSCVMWVATLLLLLQALLGIGSLTLIFGVVAIQAMGFAVASPTRSAIIPRLVDRTLVPAANTLNFTASQFGMLAGPLFAGVLLAHWHYAAAYALDAVLFTVVLYAALRLPPIPPLGDITGSPGLRSVIDGLRYLATQPVLLMSFVVDIIAMAIAMPRALFPEVAETRFGGGARSAGCSPPSRLERSWAGCRPAGSAGCASRASPSSCRSSSGGWRWRRPGSPGAVARGGAARRGRRGRPGLGGVPPVDAADVRAGQAAR